MIQSQLLRSLSRETIQRKFKFKFLFDFPKFNFHFNPNPGSQPKVGAFYFRGTIEKPVSLHSVANSDENNDFKQYPDGKYAMELQNVLKSHTSSSVLEIEQALDQGKVKITQGLVLDLLRRNRSDWKQAYVFFQWVSKRDDSSLGFDIYHEILDILGRMHRFEELMEVFDKMSERKGRVNKTTFRILVNRYAAANKVEDAIGVFHRRKEFGFEDDLAAFQVLLMCLCRYKHVEFAEALYQSKRGEFGYDIKTMNIVLNGWCVLGNVHEAKRCWKDIIESKCKPDLFTYGTFINALTKKGKLGTAMKLFRGMWQEGCYPDVVIYNCVIDALCFKKRIPEALEVFMEMRDHGCIPNVATYNSLIKHLCKIRRLEKVHEILDEMENFGCQPNDITFNILLKSLKEPEEVPSVMEWMERSACNISSDTYNLILKLYTRWDHEKRVRTLWEEMEQNGLGPDRRSYTIMIHWLYNKGRIQDALNYYNEMTSKGIIPEPRTVILVNTMEDKLKEQEVELQDLQKNGKSLNHRPKRKKKTRANR